MIRTVDPYRDLHVIDSRGPRVNQATIGVLSLVAVLTGWHWLVGLLALQLADLASVAQHNDLVGDAQYLGQLG